MGQQHSQPSSPETRLAELHAMGDRARNVMNTWQERMLEDVAAGIPKGTPGTARAVWEAALEHYGRVVDEKKALWEHLRG
jgi:hypothetical protein